MKKALLTIALLAISAMTLCAQKVEVKYFHGKQRCITCMSIEKYAQEVVREYYAKEVKSGKLKFTVIDISSEDGKKVASEYKVSFSSLFIEKGKERKDLTQIGFRYAKNNPSEFKNQLKAAIDAYLKKK